MMKKVNDVLWGLVLIAAAALLIVSKLGLISGIGFGQIIFTAVWVCLIVSGLIKRECFSVTMGIAFLCIVWSDELKINAITPWPVIAAAILIGIGWSMIFKRRHKTHFNAHVFGERSEYDPTIEEDDGEEIQCSSKFSGIVKYINSENLKSVYVKNTFGGTTLYMDKAKVPSGKVNVDLDCTFGGVEIYIPRGWQVLNNIHSTFGGVDGDVHDDTAEVTVILNGNVTFGGVDIKFL